MSRSGSLALQRLIFDYNSIGPAHGLRHAFAREIPLFKQEFPSVVIEVRPRAKPAAVTAVYRDGSERSFHLERLSSQAIYNRLHELVQDCNDRSHFFDNKNFHYQKRSVQGAWSPYLWLAERHESRMPEPKWDRKLSDREWDYYVDKYSNRMQRFRADVRKVAERREEMPRKLTKELSERWSKFVTPHLQTDMEANLAAMKKSAAQGKAPDAVSWDEYRLFAAPDMTTTGEDTMRALRRKEMMKAELWWDKRKEQLKPPK